MSFPSRRSTRRMRSRLLSRERTPSHRTVASSRPPPPPLSQRRSPPLRSSARASLGTRSRWRDSKLWPWLRPRSVRCSRTDSRRASLGRLARIRPITRCCIRITTAVQSPQRLFTTAQTHDYTLTSLPSSNLLDSGPTDIRTPFSFSPWGGRETWLLRTCRSQVSSIFLFFCLLCDTYTCRVPALPLLSARNIGPNSTWTLERAFLPAWIQDEPLEFAWMSDPVPPYCLDWTCKGLAGLAICDPWPGKQKNTTICLSTLDSLELEPFPLLGLDGLALDARYPGLPNDPDLPQQRETCNAARHRVRRSVPLVALLFGFQLWVLSFGSFLLTVFT